MEERMLERKRKVLVVDDDPDSCDIISTLLNHLGHEPVCATDSGDASSLILHDRFDLLFVDLVMPGLSGFDLLQVARSSPYNESKPVVAITAHMDYRRQAIESGFTDFLHKPVDLSRLSLLLDRLFPPE